MDGTLFDYMILLADHSKMWKSGDEVFLHNNNAIVGRGTIFDVDSTRLCHGLPIGEGCVSLSLEKSYNSTLPLPYPCMGASTLGEAIGSFVIWSKSSLSSYGSFDGVINDYTVDCGTCTMSKEDCRERRVQL